MPDKENAPGDRIAVIVVCQIDSFHDLGILDDGQLQVDHLQGKLQAFLFVEHQITDLKRREQPHADIIVARQVLAIDFGHGVAVYDRGYHIRLHFQSVGVGRRTVRLVKSGIDAGIGQIFDGFFLDVVQKRSSAVFVGNETWLDVAHFVVQFIEATLQFAFRHVVDLLQPLV